MKKNIIYLVSMLAVSLTVACNKGTEVAPVATTPAATVAPVTTVTDSFIINNTTYSVDHKYTTPDSLYGKPLTTVGVLLVHGTVTTARPYGDYAVFVDSVSTQATGTFSFHNAISTLPGKPCSSVYYDNVSGPAQLMYETLNTTVGSVTKTGARSFTFTTTVTNIFSKPQTTAQISGTITSF